jgi:5'-nucleotidase / UDP-sugar diphosphatase
LHTNDIHSKLTGTGPEFEYSPLIVNNDKTVGGFARLATIFKQVEQKSPESTLILDAGDFLMGSLFHAAEEETGFQTNLMQKMGYDFITLGNHEFDFGPETLAKIIKTAREMVISHKLWPQTWYSAKNRLKTTNFSYCFLMA